MNNSQNNPWALYDELIEGIDSNVLVKDACAGMYWSYVEAESGTGLGYSMSGGGRETFSGLMSGMSLKEIAKLSKSWNWKEASIGVAALNAWYTTEENVLALGGVLEPVETNIPPFGMGRKEEAPKPEKTNPFHSMTEEITGKKITVIGHFPWLNKIAEIAELTVLERNCDGMTDVPDPACEYVIPSQDFVFMTGVTMINKTAPRLIELAKNAVTVMVGPSVIASPILTEKGVDVLAGRIVLDPEKAKLSVKQGAKFSEALRMFEIRP